MMSPAATLYCLPPVAITAYMLTPLKTVGKKRPNLTGSGAAGQLLKGSLLGKLIRYYTCKDNHADVVIIKKGTKTIL